MDIEKLRGEFEETLKKKFNVHNPYRKNFDEYLDYQYTWMWQGFKAHAALHEEEIKSAHVKGAIEALSYKNGMKELFDDAALNESPTDASIAEACDVLKKHNAWRRGDDTEMESPTVIGKAIDVVLAALQEAKPEMNQCDGCRTQSEIKDGLHVDRYGKAFMACEKGMYDPQYWKERAINYCNHLLAALEELAALKTKPEAAAVPMSDDHILRDIDK
jgi:hypothetical protein